MMADVDQVKKLSHTFGNDTGDELLKVIAQKLHNSVRAGDWVCRHGVEGFLLAGLCSDESEMPGLAGRILTAIRALRFDVAGSTLRITISLGAALAYPGEPCQPWVVLQSADRAVRRAKEAGRDRYDVEPGVVGRPDGACARSQILGFDRSSTIALRRRGLTTNLELRSELACDPNRAQGSLSLGGVWRGATSALALAFTLALALALEDLVLGACIVGSRGFELERE